MFVYTDGACNKNGGGGWAFVAVLNGEIVHEESGAHPTKTTNNRMELMAILRAVTWIAKRRLENVFIVTDSKTSLHVLEHVRRGPGQPKNYDLVKQIKSLNVSCEFRCIKGHSGHEFNNRADKLATVARDAAFPPAKKQRRKRAPPASPFTTSRTDF